MTTVVDSDTSDQQALAPGQPAAEPAAAREPHACPNCGASLETNMAGECDHCGAKITRGDFDWVLSKIEQDDSYTG